MFAFTMKVVASVLWLILCSMYSKGELANITFERTPTSITVSWTFPQSLEASITTFRILTRYVGPCNDMVPQPQEFSVNKNVRTSLIDSLEEFSTYNITIDGISSESAVLYTASTTAQTRATRPPAPRNFRTTQITPTTVSFEWDDTPCLEENSRILEYRIFGYRGSSPISTASSQVSMYTRTRLTPDTDYSFFAYAVYYDENDVGPYQGSHSITIEVHTPSVLVTIDFTQVLPQQRSISLSWSTRVEPIEVNLVGYEISARYVGPCRVNFFPELRASIINPSVSAYSLQNLEEFSSYEVIITALTEVGTMGSANTSITTLGEGSSNSIATIAITSVEAGTNDITLSWNSTVEPSCLMILQYEIIVSYHGPCQESPTAAESFIISNSSIRQYQLSDLEELSLYEIEVRMTVEFGRVNSTSMLVATQGELGDSPLITSITSNPTSLILAWEMPSDVCVERYEITATYAGPCTDGPFSELYSAIVTTSERSASTSILDLIPYSNYNISITAIRIQSRSSVNVALRTGSSIPNAPTALQLSSVSETTANLSWKHDCLDHHASITAYVVTYAPADTYPEQANVINVNATINQYQLSGLEPGLRYIIQVFATSEHIGPGMKSELITLTTALVTEAIGTVAQVSSESNVFSNSSVVVTLIVVGALLILGILVVVVICIGVVGAVIWKRNSRKVVIVSSDSLELESCSAYGTKQNTFNSQENLLQSDYQHYERICSTENPGYGIVGPPNYNGTYNSLIQQNDNDLSGEYNTLNRDGDNHNDEYDTLDRNGGTIQNSGEYEENFTIKQNSLSDYSPN